MALMTPHFSEHEAGTPEQVDRYRANIMRVFQAAEKIREALGGYPMTVNQVVRSPEKQEELRKAGKAGESSLHLKGLAIDFNFKHGPFANQPKFVGHMLRVLQKHGVIPSGGIGIYDTHVHFDVGRTRTWDHSAPVKDENEGSD